MTSVTPPPDVLRGTLDLLILRTLSLEPMHGWGISQRIEQLSRGALAVNQGSLYFDPAIAEKASTTVPELVFANENDGGELSQREEVVLKLVSQGFSNKQIAGQLDISVKSVETYKARASEKKRLRSRADIVRYGIKQGWLAAPN